MERFLTIQTREQIHQVKLLGIPVEVCPSSNLACVLSAERIVNKMAHLIELVEIDHNIIICCDDTMLFSTNLSSEMFEFANGFQVSSSELKARLLQNVDAIFDESGKDWLYE